MIAAMFCAIWYGADRPKERRMFAKENCMFQNPGSFFFNLPEKRVK